MLHAVPPDFDQSGSNLKYRGKLGTEKGMRGKLGTVPNFSQFSNLDAHIFFNAISRIVKKE
jgi:hypothetical protein